MPAGVSPALRRSIVVALVAFVALGMSESGLGAAWPSLRRTFDRPVGDLGSLLAVGAVAYTTASAVAGRIVDRFGTGASLIAGTFLAVGGLVAYATVTVWVGGLLAAVVLGLGGGVVDTSVNAHAAHAFSPGAMNLLHGGFGIGATLGPVVMAAAVAGTGSSTIGYVFLAVVQLTLLAVLVGHRRRWRTVEIPHMSRPATRLGHVALLTLAMFFVYTGVEVSAGQWAFTELTEGRGLSVAAGGAWTASFWAGLTMGRLALSTVATRLGPELVLSSSVVVAVMGAAWFWLVPDPAALMGLPVLGLGLAGVFPTLVTLTPQRIGQSRTNAMVGYQLAAGGAGVVAIPWLMGRIVAAAGLDALAPALAVAAAVLAVLHVVLASTATRASL
jgi:fucose permease